MMTPHLLSWIRLSEGTKLLFQPSVLTQMCCFQTAMEAGMESVSAASWVRVGVTGCSVLCMPGCKVSP